ncbi:Piso0_001848 [Millerozyma farinosa CBS 7064]|uniref:Piso0_001848 protein n=1 Tax=Pichia sorbitophila (strain ATCC MYA-4447 / BCRC 22081 / CBS 7064 / NBRC 10061 / NRRL Y-12695) TaxID=559304 RepID=G8YP92_PICSO|nr:Piso0_001848 [Millerozyma farinosa CBS 7064]
MRLSLEQLFEVTKISDKEYRGNEPLLKPSKVSRGAYGGNIAAQALLVAIRSAGDGFTPHSLHSHFVRATKSDRVVVWKVKEINNGNNFKNRNLLAYQDDVITYIANVSLVKNNSHAKQVEIYEEYQKKMAEKDADDDDTRPMAKPFGFQPPISGAGAQRPVSELPSDTRFNFGALESKSPPEMDDLTITKDEDNIAPSERKLSTYIRLNLDAPINDPAFQFVGMGVISDYYFLSRLARILRIPGVDMKNPVHYMSLSLDHIVYFHDSDFDITKPFQLTFRAVRCANNRVLMEAEIYNDKGIHVVTIIQEGLVYLNGIEAEAKL